ncbi:unnamed protein product [Rhizophagus irregularis]|nr:unnamed protein product [Rhizophagus irregularis]
MDINFLSGSCFRYFIWTIIMAKESEEIFFMSHQIMLHSVVAISGFVLPIWKVKMIFHIVQKFSLINHIAIYIIFHTIHGFLIKGGSSNKLHGELVPNSVHIWDPRIKPPGNWRQKRSNAEKWNDVSDVIKDANIVLNQMDYHGNFNAEIFKDLFSTLCEILHEKYGLVNIHMDGASYHKRWVENIPTLSTKKQEIVANCSQYFLF